LAGVFQLALEGAVSWFRNFFVTLFGGKKGRPATVSSDTHRKVPPAHVAPSRVTCAEHTLGWLFQHSQTSMIRKDTYDIEHPPSIDPDVLNRLRTHISRIPPMPEIWHQVQEILQQPDASAGELGQCVAQDPVLTARILTVCNSPMYGVHNSAEISNIRLAIARLGLNESCNIIFHSLAPELGGSNYKKSEIRHIWFHSQAIAKLARLLSEPSSKLDQHTASLAGMLHDIGKLVMLHVEPESELSRLMNRIDQGSGALAAEYEAFGYTHIDAGMMLALHWRLPKSVQQMISLHHHPDAASIDKLPENIQALMAALQAAHLILQHSMDDTSDRDRLSVWHGHLRSCGDDMMAFVQGALNIPLDSTALFAQLQAEIERLKLSFPDLFEPKD